MTQETEHWPRILYIKCVSLEYDVKTGLGYSTENTGFRYRTQATGLGYRTTIYVLTWDTGYGMGLLLAAGVHVDFVDGIEGGVVYLVLGGGVLEVEQVDEAVAPQHLVRQVRGLGLHYQGYRLHQQRLRLHH
jgi:hypothetical protein